MKTNIKDIYIKQESSRFSYKNEAGYYLVIKRDYGNDHYWKTGTKVEKITCYDLHCAIVSLGKIKIKNILTKDFNAKISTDYDEPYFETEEEAKKALEWINQKHFETTLIGKDTIEQEKKRKNAENATKRTQKENEKIEKNAAEVIESLKQYIGKDITFPVCISNSNLKFKTKLLGISFRDHKYILKTDAGEVKVFYKYAHIQDGQLTSAIDGRNGKAYIRASGPAKILFKE